MHILIINYLARYTQYYENRIQYINKFKNIFADIDVRVSIIITINSYRELSIQLAHLGIIIS